MIHFHENFMKDTADDDYKSTKDTERKHLKRKKAKENQSPKIQKDNQDLAGEDEEYSVEKVLGKRLGKKGTIGKLLTIFILENVGLPSSFQLLYFPSRIFVEMERL